MPGPSAQDRWADIRKNTAERAAQRHFTSAEPVLGSRLAEFPIPKGRGSEDGREEETIQSRVARIKVRVAELIAGQTSESRPELTQKSKPETVQESRSVDLPAVSASGLTVEELSDFKPNDDEQVPPVRPHDVEYPKSNSSSDLDEAEFQELLMKRREEKRRRKMTSGSVGKRTISETIRSDNDQEDI
ncbi:hypothetical protein QBC38DRAFT_138453 [Podospora fimiseda]|uniref:Uncharacterized protein n=1 Tax=Podospora fimiseda TaxID=252190 RepID=A0AAN6YMH0_9PEZI|nr:hypothetical protein QBC38DRAFT_138453 [Podospora fimiseda]